MAYTGPQGLFIFSAGCLLVFALVIALRRRAHVLPVHDETEPFRAVSNLATPMALELDPRTESEHPPADEEPPAADKAA